MTRILLALALLLMPGAASSAETQTSKYNRLRKTLQSMSLDSHLVNPFLAGVVNVYYYDTAVELLAAAPTEGIIGYAIDTNAYYLRAGSSWVGLAGLGSLTGASGGTLDNATNNAWEFGENSELWAWTAGTNTLTLSSSTGVATMLTAMDLSLSGGAGALTLTDSASSIVMPDNDATALLAGSTGRLNLLTLDTTDNAEKLIITGTTATTALSVPVGESSFVEGVNMAVPAMALTEIRFCGNGPNATTATYIGPVVEADFGADMTFGAAGCDAKDNTTEATADAPWNPSLAFKPVAMVCTTTCGTDDTMTLQLRDDTANVAGMTCDITLAGAAAQCVVRDASPATVAANSAIAIRVVNSTDDNCSAGDIECRVFVTY